MGYTEISHGEIVAEVLGGITAVGSLGILFILSPSLSTLLAPVITDIQL